MSLKGRSIINLLFKPQEKSSGSLCCLIAPLVSFHRSACFGFSVCTSQSVANVTPLKSGVLCGAECYCHPASLSALTHRAELMMNPACEWIFIQKDLSHISAAVSSPGMKKEVSSGYFIIR